MLIVMRRLCFLGLLLIPFLGCALRPASVFKNPEIAYLRSLFRPVNTPSRQTLGKPDLEKAAIDSFKTHPAEVIPLLTQCWKEGWQTYPWQEETPKGINIPPLDDDILQLLICLDTKTAENILIQKYYELKGMPGKDYFRREIVANLYLRLHSNKWKKLFKALAEEKPDEWSYMYVCYCAQENDPDALPYAKSLLANEKTEQTANQLQAYICQIEENSSALEAMSLKFKSTNDSLIPLWSLIFMGRKDIVEKLESDPIRMDTASRVLNAHDKWQADKKTSPCETKKVKSLSEMTVLNHYTPRTPTM